MRSEVHSRSFLQIRKKAEPSNANTAPANPPGNGNTTPPANEAAGLIEGEQTDRIELNEQMALPDLRIPPFDKSKCKEGEDVFMCMTDHLSKH